MDKSKTEQTATSPGWTWTGVAVLLAGLCYVFGLTLTPTAQISRAASASPTVQTPPPSPLRSVAASTTPTPSPSVTPIFSSPPGSVVFTLTPAAEAVGWVSSLDGRSHFGFPNIHAGFLGGHIYYGAIQFDLSTLPPGATLTGASLELTGLDGQNLGTGGIWQINLLAPTIDAAWPRLTYQLLHQAPIEATLAPQLTVANLGQSQINRFQFAPVQLTALTQHLSNGLVSFRVAGPTSAPDNLFTWDTGYHGEQELTTRPVLRLVAVLPPTPQYVIVTSTSTPENLVTAAALAATATEVAATLGPSTPIPPNWVTPLIVTAQPTPANAATAAFQTVEATAAAFLFGPATATPPNLWTATPMPAHDTPLPDQTTTPGANQAPLHYVIVTSTATPENIITAAAIAISATRVAQTTGTYTPIPANWVTPMVVTPQPKPANAATAAYVSALATAEAVLYPTPVARWTATATPIFILLDSEIATPWATFTPTATPQSIPPVLVGKIAFLSNRSGGPEPLREPLAYVMDPDGSHLAVLTNRAMYDAAVARDSYSADQRFRAFVKYADIWTSKKKPAIFVYDYFYGAEAQVTQFGAGIAYDPVWSPTREQLALVSNDSGNDEIWVINRDGSGALQLTNDPYGWWDKHPSWSPDGSQLVFWSNRTGQRQIWVVQADGSTPRSLSRTGYDDWDPVWIKYLDPARSPK